VIKKAGKTVYLAKEVPPEFLKRSERAEEELSPEESSPD
jgi:RNA:NAD 2'-phosphotransferase (TPT1/KptA family)